MHRSATISSNGWVRETERVLARAMRLVRDPRQAYLAYVLSLWTPADSSPWGGHRRGLRGGGRRPRR